jgi:hypothetical protein
VEGRRRKVKVERQKVELRGRKKSGAFLCFVFSMFSRVCNSVITSTLPAILRLVPASKEKNRAQQERVGKGCEEKEHPGRSFRDELCLKATPRHK